MAPLALSQPPPFALSLSKGAAHQWRKARAQA